MENYFLDFFVQSLYMNFFEVMQMLKLTKNIHFRFCWSLKPGLVCPHIHNWTPWMSEKQQAIR